TDVARKHDVWHADGAAHLWLPERDDAGQHGTEYGRSSDLERLARDIARRNAALRDDKAWRRCVEHVTHQRHERSRDGARDGEALVAAAAGHESARGVDHHVVTAQCFDRRGGAFGDVLLTAAFKQLMHIDL